MINDKNWQKKKLKDVADYINGRGFKKSEWSKTGKPIIRIQNLTGSKSTVNYFDGIAKEQHQISEGDLLVSWSATIGSYIYKGEDAVLNQHIFKVKPKINKLFLHYYFTYIGQKLYAKTHGTGMSHITKKVFEEIEILVPKNKKIQQKIVDKIEELFSVIDTIEEQLNDLVLTSNQFFKKLLAKKLKSNEIVKLKDIVSFGPKNGTSPKGVSHKTSIKNLTLTATTGGYFNANHFKYVDVPKSTLKDLQLHKNDILVQRGNTIEYVGTAALINDDYPNYIYPDLMMKIRVKDNWNPEYVTFNLRLQQHLGYFRDNAIGTSGNMPKINQKILKLTPIYRVKKEIQDRKVSEIKVQLSKMSYLLNTIEQSNKKISNLKQSILKQAFEGKLV